MSSISSTNPALTNLLQTLTNLNSPIMSSQKAVSALQNASPADIAQLSEEAVQLQNVDLIFGEADGAASNAQSAGASLLSSLAQSLTPSGTATTQASESGLPISPPAPSLIDSVG